MCGGPRQTRAGSGKGKLKEEMLKEEMLKEEMLKEEMLKEEICSDYDFFFCIPSLATLLL